MKTQILFFILAFGFFISAFGQKPSIELTFTAINNDAYIQLDSIKVMNLTQGCDTVLYWPDTVLTLDYLVGLYEISTNKNKFQVFQNYPNPVVNQTNLSLYIPDKGEVNLVITDILGRQVINTERVFEKGYHSFKFKPGSGKIFLFTAHWNSISRSIKILNTRIDSDNINLLEYDESNNSVSELKMNKSTQNFYFSIGDELIYTGYSSGLQLGILDSPVTNIDYVFQFATCPGTPTVEDEDGNIYNTVQIGDQCWMRENIRVGTRIDGSQEMSNTGTIEKYCFDDNPDNCDTYGGLYQWNEMMQYTTTTGVKGICPIGWHIPTDNEWKILEGNVDTQYGVGDPEWNGDSWRGLDAGERLKTTTGWNENTGINAVGFSCLAGGNRYGSGSFNNLGSYGRWWSSTEDSDMYAWCRTLHYSRYRIERYDGDKILGFSVRCLKD